MATSLASQIYGPMTMSPPHHSLSLSSGRLCVYASTYVNWPASSLICAILWPSIHLTGLKWRRLLFLDSHSSSSFAFTCRCISTNKVQVPVPVTLVAVGDTHLRPLRGREGRGRTGSPHFRHGPCWDWHGICTARTPPASCYRTVAPVSPRPAGTLTSGWSLTQAKSVT